MKKDLRREFTVDGMTADSNRRKTSQSESVVNQILGEDQERSPIERLIYSGSTQSFTKEDWVELAMTALDQAGLKLDEQSKVRALLTGMGYGPEEQVS